MSTPPVPTPAAPSKGMGLRWTYAILIVAFLFVLMPFLFWQATWFGKPLSDEEISTNLADQEHPRKIQHALSQLADRMGRGDASARRWYPQIAALAGHKTDEIRVTAAWVMGQDNHAIEFIPALHKLLEDAHPMVQRNAGLSLVRFGDATGKPQILSMLQPYAARAPASGNLAQRLKVGDGVNPGTMLARIRSGSNEQEVRSQVPGTVQQWIRAEGAAVQAGEEIVSLAPSGEMAFESLRALVIVGQSEDIPVIEKYLSTSKDLQDSIRQQAELTIRSIKSRLPRQ
ncbi:MAG: HEAT repeat domain-containing protein [Acidobacteria bacterium]|nr:HEAT repeat domain-containing protein [Acidobacteriota bacterium]